MREIVRLAARGDGVTVSGEHVAGGVPGDQVDPDGSIIRGEHHVEPPCRHFERCGGCQLQHADETVLHSFVRERVAGAARGQGLAVGHWLDAHLSPPHSRRRATMHGLREKRRAVLGYRQGRSHQIVDLAECPVIERGLMALVAPLRNLIGRHGGKNSIDVGLTMSDQGVDVGLSNLELDGLAATEDALEFARSHDLARLTVDQGYGADVLWEPEPTTMTLSGLPVALPPGAFLQATADAEAVMAADAREWVAGSSNIVDLFAGLGTFAFALASAGEAGRRIAAVEAERSAHLACKTAAARTGGTVAALHRDLFRNPLQPSELQRFDAALLDPPRAGARAQIEQIAASELSRVVYVSCNPSSWARDAEKLIEGGFVLEKVRPVGQFRWSTHVELISLFVRT